MLASAAEKFLCSRLILGTGTLGLSEQPAEGPSQVWVTLEQKKWIFKNKEMSISKQIGN